MLVPWAFNSWHTTLYTGNPIGATTEPRSMFGTVPLSFFLSFDGRIFEHPFAFEAGSASYWTLQYVTMHSDYYNHWNSTAYDSLPPEARIDIGHRQPMPRERYALAQALQTLAVPVTGLMLLGLLYSAYRVVFRTRNAVRDGSLLVVLLFVVAQAAQLVRFGAYADVRSVLIHARYLAFLYIILLVAGMLAWWRLVGWRRTVVAWLGNVLIAAVLLAYAVVAYALLWLPSVVF
jgi:hypothetical protein